MFRIIFCLVVAVTLSPMPAWAASAYSDLLKSNFAMVLITRNDPRVPDEIESEMLNCLADAFISANIPPEDLSKLDQAVIDGTIEQDPLAGYYAMLASDPVSLSRMASESVRLCPETIKAFDGAKKG